MYFMDRSGTKLPIISDLITIKIKPEVSGFSIYILTLRISKKTLTTDNQNFIIKIINKNISHYKEKKYL